MAELGESEFAEAKQTWEAWPVKSWYRTVHPYALAFAERLAGLGPESILEFGCNVGRNLDQLRELRPELRLVGIDVNPDAIAAGREASGLDLRVGDETALWDFAEGEFDLVFTLSVLDHIADIDRTCEALVHCAARTVVCLEVGLPVEGKVLRHFDHNRAELASSTAASYSWDVAARLRRHPRVARVDERPVYLHRRALGPYYIAAVAHLR